MIENGSTPDQKKQRQARGFFKLRLSESGEGTFNVTWLFENKFLRELYNLRSFVYLPLDPRSFSVTSLQKQNEQILHAETWKGKYTSAAQTY